MYFEKSPSLIQRTKTQSVCFPCFFGSPVADSDDPELTKRRPPAAQAGSKRKVSAWFSYSGVPKKENKKKKKEQTVDVPSTAPAKNITAETDRPKDTPAAEKCLDDVKPFSGQNRTAGSLGEICKSNVRRPKPAQPTSPTDPSPIAKSSADQSGSKRRNRPISLDRSSARTAGFAPLPGLCVLAATLAVLVFFGRASAVICLCSCFYVLQLTRAMAVATAAAETRRVSRDAYMDSSEYKKRVVVEGLLERSSRRFDGRRTSPRLLPFPSAS